jgi:hypothetical protein
MSAALWTVSVLNSSDRVFARGLEQPGTQPLHMLQEAATIPPQLVSWEP